MAPPLYVKVLRKVLLQGVGGDELWSQVDTVDQIMHHTEGRRGPVWERLLNQTMQAQGGVEGPVGELMAEGAREGVGGAGGGTSWAGTWGAYKIGREEGGFVR